MWDKSREDAEHQAYQWVLIGTSLSAEVPQRTGIERDADHIQNKGRPGTQHTCLAGGTGARAGDFPEYRVQPSLSICGELISFKALKPNSEEVQFP